MKLKFSKHIFENTQI